MNEFMQPDRRAVMRSVALLLGATVVPTLASCKAATEGEGALDQGQLKLLTAIADTIIPETDTPGAVAANVPKLLSGMIRDWASEKTRAELTGAIAEIGKLSGEKNFADLDPVARKTLLAEHDKAAVKPGPPPKEKSNALLAMAAGPPTANPGYVRLKGLIVNLYYSSEIASTEELIYEHVPGKFEPSLKVTPDTRPFAGVGGPL